MIRNRKVQKMLIQNNIEQENFTLVLRLKKKIQQLNAKIEQQDLTIVSLKRNFKTTKINEMEIEIQHLNDENKRLLLIIEDLKGKQATSSAFLSPKKMFYQANKFQERKPIVTEIKCDNKMYDVLKENQCLKKELLNYKVNENLLKKRKSTINDRSSIFIQKNLVDYEKLCQKKMDLQAQKVVMSDKIKKLQHRIGELTKRNDELQKAHVRWIGLQQSLR